MNIFIAGSRAISKLNKIVEDKLYGIYERKYTVLVGDANGVDKAVQKYFSELNYANVIVYASNGKARNNLGNWQIKSIPVSENIKGFDFYAEKDKAMANSADYGFMVWDGKSKGTLNNIVNLLNKSKKTLVFFSPENLLKYIDCFEKLEDVLQLCNNNTKELFVKMPCNMVFTDIHMYTHTQESLFENKNFI